MSIHTTYRVCVWLPIVVPVLVILTFNVAGWRLADGVVGEIFTYSLVYGGLPYAVLAAWATWWIGGRSEPEIRRLMFRAPLLMVAAFAGLALSAGVLAGRLGPFAALAMVGGVAILGLGYGYVGLTLLLRYGLGSAIKR